ncbi:hypothetical protein L7F22_036997 [Adiantum nelumboides]|nr:hypothetical protein [Adiantum nelumboides]
MADLGVGQDTANTIYTDSQSTLAIARNPIFHACTKHIEHGIALTDRSTPPIDLGHQDSPGLGPKKGNGGPSKKVYTLHSGKVCRAMSMKAWSRTHVSEDLGGETHSQPSQAQTVVENTHIVDGTILDEPLLQSTAQRLIVKQRSEPPMVPLCRLVPNEVLRKAEHQLEEFGDSFDCHGYLLTGPPFLVLFHRSHGGDFQEVSPIDLAEWGPNWVLMNDKFEEELIGTEWEVLRGRKFLVWEGNHRLKHGCQGFEMSWWTLLCCDYSTYPNAWMNCGFIQWELERCPWWLDYPLGRVPPAEQGLWDGCTKLSPCVSSLDMCTAVGDYEEHFSLVCSVGRSVHLTWISCVVRMCVRLCLGMQAISSQRAHQLSFLFVSTIDCGGESNPWGCRAITVVLQEGDAVVDVMAGCGELGRVCHRIRRHYFGVEDDPDVADACLQDYPLDG